MHLVDDRILVPESIVFPGVRGGRGFSRSDSHRYSNSQLVAPTRRRSRRTCAGITFGFSCTKLLAPLPGIASVAQQVVHLVRLVRPQPPLFDRQPEDAALRVVRVQVDDADDNVARIVGLLAVGDQLVVVDTVETQAPVRLQRLVLPPGLVHQRDQVAQAVRPVDLPVALLVLLGVQVLLAARLSWLVFHQLERWAVDAVVGR